MSNQEIFEVLAYAECELFQLSADNPENADLKEAHAAAKKALEAFARATGCHN